MKASFPADPIGAAIFFTILSMGLIGLLIILPVFCILWGWNSMSSYVTSVPAINSGQAILLYLAATALIYLSGLVSIRIERELD